MNVIEWTAYSGNLILDTTIKSKSLKQAVKESKEYLENNLKGEGTIRIYKNSELFCVYEKKRNSQYTVYKPRLIPLNSENRWWLT